MGILDKVIGAVTPEPSDEKMKDAREKARAAAETSGWFKLILEHHTQIESLFQAVRGARDAVAQRAAQRKLAIVLTGHSIAEEAVIYPAMALSDQKIHSGEAYTEQSAAKVQMAALEDLTPMSQDYLDKLEHIRGAVSQHIYEEESQFFIDLANTVDAAKQSKLTMRYQEEYARYVGVDA